MSRLLGGITRRFLTVFTVITLLSGLAANSLASAHAYAESPAPTINNQYVGTNSTLNSPPSTTIAANAKEEIQLTNLNYDIYTKAGKQIIGPLSKLVGTNGTFLSDVQIIWDNSTSRFYFSTFENKGFSTPEEGIAWGFSKTANPSGASDFCTYFNQFNYGSTYFPDKESLGDTSNFLLIGAERYAVSDDYIQGSDLAWIAKPPAGNKCPSPSSFASGISSLQNPDGSSPWIPTPARQVDSSSTGFVLATPSYVSGNSLTIYTVTKGSNGNAVISSPSSVAVKPYYYPPNAPQKGTTLAGDPAPPLETRIYLTQDIMAYDPSVGHDDLWTANTVAGGAGSEVQWYEIDPYTASVDQQGDVSDPNLYVFNGTITPDRIVNGKKTAYGNAAIVNVSTSSANNYPAIQMESIISGQSSPLTMVQQSTGTDVDFSCFEPNQDECRWGDYSGSVPDPGAPLNAAHGKMWLTNQWNTPDIDDSTPVWQTTVWNATP